MYTIHCVSFLLLWHNPIMKSGQDLPTNLLHLRFQKSSGGNLSAFEGYWINEPGLNANHGQEWSVSRCFRPPADVACRLKMWCDARDSAAALPDAKRRVSESQKVYHLARPRPKLGAFNVRRLKANWEVHGADRVRPSHRSLAANKRSGPQRLRCLACPFPACVTYNRTSVPRVPVISGEA